MAKGRFTGGRVAGKSVNKVTALARRKLAEAELSADNTVEAIRRGALFDPRKLFDSNGNPRPIKDLSEAEAWAIRGYEIILKNAKGGDGETDEVLKVQLVDRSRYVEMAAKLHALLTDKMDVNVTDVGNRLEAAREAARQRNAARGKDKG